MAGGACKAQGACSLCRVGAVLCACSRPNPFTGQTGSKVRTLSVPQAACVATQGWMLSGLSASCRNEYIAVLHTGTNEERPSWAEDSRLWTSGRFWRRAEPSAQDEGGVAFITRGLLGGLPQSECIHALAQAAPHCVHSAAPCLQCMHALDSRLCPITHLNPAALTCHCLGAEVAEGRGALQAGSDGGVR